MVMASVLQCPRADNAVMNRGDPPLAGWAEGAAAGAAGSLTALGCGGYG